jgi:hypothetical protein
VVNDLSAANVAIGARGIASSGAVAVPPANANGLILAFVKG